MSRRWLAALLCVCGVAGACTTDEPRESTAKPVAAAKKSNPSAWKEIETPVAVGKKLPCAGIIQLDKIAEATGGRKLELVDESGRDPDATSVCRLMVAKPQPKGAPAVKGGVAPGDELATVSVYCWAAFTVPEVKKRCTDNGEETSTDIGSLTCVRKVAAGDNTRYIVTVLEPDTRCKLVVNPGPSNIDLAVQRQTAQALVDTIDKDSLKAK